MGVIAPVSLHSLKIGYSASVGERSRRPPKRWTDLPGTTPTTSVQPGPYSQGTPTAHSPFEAMVEEKSSNKSFGAMAGNSPFEAMAEEKTSNKSFGAGAGTMRVEAIAEKHRNKQTDGVGENHDGRAER